jgi:WS/DGAT/MGAT family acyltransferase
MRQLTGLDASFLYLETPNAPMHVAGLSIYDPSTAPGGKVRFKEIINNIGQRYRDIPAATERLVHVPFDLDHPYWVNDGTFDPEFHIRHVALPKPGDWRQLCILVSRLHARALDRSRPLWEMWIIEGLDKVEGLPKGCFAIFAKNHHAAIDGTSGMEMSVALHDLSPDYQSSTKSNNVYKTEFIPSGMKMIANSTINNLKKPFHFLGVVKNTVPSFAKAVAGLSKGTLKRVKNVPRTRFNTKVSPYRVFDAASFSLDDIKKIKNSVDSATVNDVAITIVGGALRKYLQAHKELPEESLAALAPINIRSAADKTGGNIVSGMIVQVRSDIEDPLERLKAVHENTARAKELTSAIGAKAMTDYSQFVPSLLTAQAARLISRSGLVNKINPMNNCTITNVPGPNVPLYSTGAKMIANFGSAPITDGMGLLHVISSYCGQFTVSFTSCRVMMPDPEFYTQCIIDSFDELHNTVSDEENG